VARELLAWRGEDRRLRAVGVAQRAHAHFGASGIEGGYGHPSMLTRRFN
jgi:hypothetical protein